MCKAFVLSRYWTLLGLVLACWPLLACAQAPMTITIEHAQTAGISGFRAQWDTPRPGELKFDAVHRSLLVRFPGLAEQVAAQLAKGYMIERVELLLPYDQTEVIPEGYAYQGYRVDVECKDIWKRIQPQWHATAWVLRQPWVADPACGPTFNASINGVAYWAKYGAQDTVKDRFPMPFGPAEISTAKPDGRLDLTAVLKEGTYGKTLAKRLRLLEDCGMLLRKWETYDFRFRENGQGAYEWGVPTGGRAIIIKSPRLEITLAPSATKASVGKLPPSANITALVAATKPGKAAGQPTAVMPTDAQLAALAEQFRGKKRPAGMTDWQWQRVQELSALGGFQGLPATRDEYAAWIDGLLKEPPRYWNMWDTPSRLMTYYLFAEAMPAPVREHLQNYWTAWLMPDRPTSELDHPQLIEIRQGGKNLHYEKTGDWRGNHSFFRAGYCYELSTMNFNHTAAMGALLGGGIIHAPSAMADGRYGFETFPLRTWSWMDGSQQESIDHYYYAMTLSAQKMFADFALTAYDRLMAQSVLVKSVEELSTVYHPGLRRMISSAGRTGPEYLWLSQDGLQHVLHSLSPRGALHDLRNPALPGGMKLLGTDVPPGVVAQQTLRGPWAPGWVSNIVDEKPLPFESTARYNRFWEGIINWKRTYLGQHYGLASIDQGQGNAICAMSQWRRTGEPVENVSEIGTLLMRFGVNLVNMQQSFAGVVGDQGGGNVSLQHKNKLLFLTSPLPKLGGVDPKTVRSVQTAIGLFDFQPVPTWEVYVDGQRVTALPCMVKAGQRITIKDGVSYLGVIPLPATDLGRTCEVEITPEGFTAHHQSGGTSKPALVINSYNLKRDAVIDAGAMDWAAVDRASGGFVVEIGDATEYADFAAFQRHMAETALEAKWEDAANTLHVKYRSGADLLEAGFLPLQTGDKQFAYRKVNGAWPYLSPGIERDTTLTQQGSTGRLEKGGAVLTTDAGRMAYLQTDPVSGTYCGVNPLPDSTDWQLQVPDGITINADGRLGLARMAVCPKENRLWIEYAVPEVRDTPTMGPITISGTRPVIRQTSKQEQADMAQTLLVFGLSKPPVVERNGVLLVGKSVMVNIDTRRAYVIPLLDTPLNLDEVKARYQRVLQRRNGMAGK